MRGAAVLLVGLALATTAGAFLISNSPFGGNFVYEAVPANRRPLNILVDTEAIPGVADPLAVAQDAMNRWNAIPEAADVFGVASAGGPYNGGTVGATFGVFTDTLHEVAFDDTGQILSHFGISPTVLGITIKSVDVPSGSLLDFLIVINTQPGALAAPGTGATAEQLFSSTLLHELGHGLGIGHTPVGMVNNNSFGFSPAAPSQIPAMYPFRIPIRPQEGMSLEGDDIAAAIESYPAATGGLGSLSGTVRGLSGAPVNEIAVRAIGPAGAAEEQVGILTGADSSGQGTFRIPNLPPGGYRVIIEAVNGRSGVTGLPLASGTQSLGGNVFLHAADEHWQPGDTYDPLFDDPSVSGTAQVRAGRDTGSIHFVLNASPIRVDDLLAQSLATGDARLPGPTGGFHFADYFVFSGNVGETATIVASSGTLTPQLRLLAPGDLSVITEHIPTGGSTASISQPLDEAGIYTIAVFARSTTGNPGGTGPYTLNLTGAGGALPAVPAVTGATAAAGPANPAGQQFANPVCALALLQVRLIAPSHEELWVDQVLVRGTGSGSETEDVVNVSLVRDLDGNGTGGAGEPVLASGSFDLDNGTVLLGDLGLVLDPGETMDLLVVYDVTVTSVSSAAGLPSAWWLLPAVLLLSLLRRRREVALLLCCALMPLSCGGGGGAGCNGPFDPLGVAVTFQAQILAGEITAFTPTSDPLTPLDLPVQALVSGTLAVSN